MLALKSGQARCECSVTTVTVVVYYEIFSKIFLTQFNENCVVLLLISSSRLRPRTEKMARKEKWCHISAAKRWNMSKPSGLLASPNFLENLFHKKAAALTDEKTTIPTFYLEVIPYFNSMMIFQKNMKSFGTIITVQYWKYVSSLVIHAVISIFDLQWIHFCNSIKVWCLKCF